ncbi:hypothetical protein QBC42DRAFT_53604 [Cladorrhinum samala]|uniref:Uncharacterized protein n=1 Tax=Cladorrhinum samala TaxID=585594 RepID=A0AAV9H9F4_9PEZI|nr:hypothetical protein QBC42DRAFT_53604 [Cladorrhinum samala]
MADLLPFNPQCTPRPCMSQVAESADRLSACQSFFGFPKVATVTLPGDDVLVTSTSTYTDVVIVVTTSTTYSTAEETSTIYETVHSTATEYTTTVTNTVSTAVTALPAVSTLKKKKLRRRGQCKPITGTTTASPTTTTAISAPSDEPIIPPSECENFSEWSSACACLDLGTVTESTGVPATWVKDEIVTVSAPSTTGTVVTVGVTTVVVKPATTTLVSTLSTQTVAITTVTSTIVPAPPVPTSFRIMLDSGSSAGQYLSLYDGSAPLGLIAADTGMQFYLPLGGDTLSMGSDNSFIMYVSVQGAEYGPVYFSPPSSVFSDFSKATCRLDPDTLIVSCSVPGLVAPLDSFKSCGNVIMLTTPTMNQGGCRGPIQMKAVAV